MNLDHASLHAWMHAWAACIRAVDYAAARGMFSPDVVSFGTRAKSMMFGLDALERRQWRNVWGVTSGFRFDLDKTRCVVSPDRRVACVVAPWASRGKRPDGRGFTRRGRCTLLLQRKAPRAPWRAVHSHLSLNP
jgi:ketosteroid isomerase-like protein